MAAKKSAPEPQSTTQRRAAETSLTSLLDKIAPDQQRLTAALREALRTRLPSAHEIIYEYANNVTISYSPTDKGYAGVLALQVCADQVRLYFNNGKGMPDPEKLLNGSAKLVRWIPVESAATLKRPAVMALIDAALARNPVPFATTGVGPIVIRLKAGK
jgi:hypothetical protein